MVNAAENLTDSVLLSNWRNGDKQAFNKLFDRYFNKLSQYVTARLGDTILAEELVMDVMMRLWQNKELLHTSDSLSPWLFRCVKNAIIDHKRKKALEVLSMDRKDFLHPLTSHPEEHYNSAELQGLYIQSLDRLSPQRRKVFELSRQEGKSLKEIAQEMDISVSTVKKHINASLHIIRTSLKDYTDWVLLIALISSILVV